MDTKAITKFDAELTGNPQRPRSHGVEGLMAAMKIPQAG